MSVVNAIAQLLGDDGYQISRSVRLRSSASAYFNRTPASAGNRKTWTWSAWLKIGAMPASDIRWFSNADLISSDFAFIYQNGGTFRFYSYVASIQADLITSAVFRDPSSWYHFVVSVDTTQATSSSRIRIYVNGVQITAFSTTTYPTQNTDLYCNTATNHNIGRYQGNSQYFDGYLTEINFIDGQALTPSSFGQTNTVTGVWQPIKYTGTYGTNGFYLNFSDPSAATAAAIGKDYSGNGNNWTPNNISVTAGVTYDSMIDTPTPYADGGNGRGNYAVLNPNWSGNGGVLSNGNLQYSYGSAAWATATGTIGVSSGKWYWEIVYVSGTSGIVGITNGQSNVQTVNFYAGQDTNSYGYYSVNGNKYYNGSASAYGASVTYGDVVGVALDMDAGTLTMYKNNVSQGVMTSGLTGSWFPALCVNNAVGGINFGQRPFAYTPPTGFKALNTQNLPDATITKGNKHFDALLWTGDGANPRTLTGLNFQPDFGWFKARSTAYDNALFDSVRGVQNYLLSNSTASEATAANSLQAFNSNGYQVGGNNYTNSGSVTYVAWGWKAGGTAVSNTAGSITSQVSANTTAGFSVVTYTGTGANATVGHGLGVAPKMVIIKPRSTANPWSVYHASVGATAYLLLNTTDASATNATFMNNTSPSSTVFSLGSGTYVNQSTVTHVAYCFSEVSGYSKFGSYTGNGSADGPFVYCGFRPRYVLIKNASDGTGQWIVNDSARGTYNQPANALYPNLSNAEDTSHPLDFYANGFKPRSSAAHSNGNGNTIIYAAFAENPFKNSLAR